VQISLKEVTKQNYESVCDLSVSKEQEDYVAENTWSLVESMFNDSHITRAIYNHSDVVGFFMWVQETEKKISIWRFMIDHKFQQNGIGRKALQLALEEIKETEELEVIEICYNPCNPVAKGFYSDFGFNEIGMDEENEDMLATIKV